MAKLQVALDLTDLDKAIEIAKAVVDAGAHIVEVGTPLIKSCGMEAVRKVRSACPEEVLVVADLKTFDTGFLEASMAYESGADIATVMALAPDETIAGAAAAACKYGKMLMVDYMNVSDVVARAFEVSGIFYRAIHLLHVGIDVQRSRGVSVSELAEEVRRVKSVTGADVAVAGGINERSAHVFANAGADIIIVGKAITGSEDPYNAAKAILKAISR